MDKMNLIKIINGKKYQWFSSYSTKEEAKESAKHFCKKGYRIFERKDTDYDVYGVVDE